MMITSQKFSCNKTLGYLNVTISEDITPIIIAREHHRNVNCGELSCRLPYLIEKTMRFL